MKTTYRRCFVPVAFLSLACVLTSQGCTITMRTLPPPSHELPPSAVPDSRPLTRDEIVEIATWIAHDRGYHDFWIEEIEREDDHRWEVEIEGVARGRRGELELLLDGWDGRVLKVKDKRKEREHDHDDDD